MSQRLPSASAKQVIKVLQRAGFQQIRTRGSHRIFGHPDRPELRVTVPDHGKRDLKTGTLVGILRQADMSVERFLSLL